MKHQCHRAGLFSLIFCLVFLFSGCTTKIAYNYMDWGIEWKIKRLVRLDDPQKLQTKEAIDAFHSWHRKTQLPLYSAYLQSLQSRLDKTQWNADAIHAETDAVQLLLDQSITYTIPHITSVLSQLDDDKVKELLASVAEERQEFIDEYVDLSRKKQIEKRYDDFYDHFKDWLGAASKQQKQDIHNWAESLEPYEHLSAEQQLTWEQQFRQLLAQRQNKTNLKAGLEKLMYFHSDEWNPDLEAVLDRNQAKTYTLIADLLNHMSDKQRAHIHKKLAGFIDVFEELHQQN